MKFRIAAALYTSLFFIAGNTNASSPSGAGTIPVWQQQISVAIDEFMHRWSDQAKLTAETEIEYQVSTLDPRLNLPACEQTPRVENKGDLRSGRLTVRVFCDSDKSWNLYVPLVIKRMHPVVHMHSSLPRMAVIGRSDIELRKTNIDDLSYGFFTSIDDAAGMIARRTLNTGEPLSPSQVEPPKLVQKGDNVLIEASNTAISVKMPGMALADGRKGQQIPVKNMQSQRTIRAKVVESGRVMVPL